MDVLQTASVPAPWPLFTDKETEAEGCESVSSLGQMGLLAPWPPTSSIKASPP